MARRGGGGTWHMAALKAHMAHGNAGGAHGTWHASHSNMAHVAAFAVRNGTLLGRGAPEHGHDCALEKKI